MSRPPRDSLIRAIKIEMPSSLLFEMIHFWSPFMTTEGAAVSSTGIMLSAVLIYVLLISLVSLVIGASIIW